MAEFRAAIIRMHENGVNHSEIARLLNIPRTTVNYQLNPKQRPGEQRKKGSGRPRTTRTPKVIRSIKGRLRRNKSSKMNSSRKLAKKLKVHRSSVQRILKQDLGKKFFKMRKRHLLTDAMKVTRFQRAKKLLKRFAANRHRSIVFSDEKLFDIEQAYNPQNDGVWADEAPPTEERLVERKQKPSSVMAWGAITHQGKSPLVFVEKGVKINQENYREMLADHLLPWTDEHFGRQLWTYQQDSAPAHKARNTQTWLRDNVPSFITKDEWPPNSPDLNPLDYAIWGIIESKACEKPHKNIESLKRALVKAWNDLDLETISRAVDEFPKRLKKCIQARGGHFE